MVFIGLKKTYNSVLREVIMSWVLEIKGVSLKYIKLIKDMYDRAVISVGTSVGFTSVFSISIGLHQGLTLSPYLFTLVMDVLTKSIQEKVSWYMLLAENIILVDETRCGVNVKLKIW